MGPTEIETTEALAGQLIGARLKNLSKREVKIGSVITNAKNDPAIGAARIVAQIMVMMSPINLKKGFEAILHCRMEHVRCRLHAIIAKLDKKGNPTETNPKQLKQGDSALVELVPYDPICVEAFSDYPSFGRIVFRDSSFRILHDERPLWQHQNDFIRPVIVIGIVKHVDKMPQRNGQANPSETFFL